MIGLEEDHDGVRRGAGSTMVVTETTGVSWCGCRRWTGSRWLRRARVVDAPAGWLREKFEQGVTEVRKDVGERKKPKARRGVASTHRNRTRTAAAPRNFGEKIRRPGGVLGARVWGKRERRSWALSRRRRGVNWCTKSSGIKTGIKRKKTAEERFSCGISVRGG